MGAGTAGAGFGTVWYHRWSRPIPGPPAAVSFPGLLVCYGTTDHGKLTTPRGILSQSFTLVICIISLGGARLANAQRPGGVRGRGVSHEGSTPSAGGEQQRPGSNPGICSSLPNRTPPTCTPRCAMVVPRPPIGRALGATVVRPPLVSAVLAVCRANTGRRGGPFGPNLPARELLGSPCPWGT